MNNNTKLGIPRHKASNKFHKEVKAHNLHLRPHLPRHQVRRIHLKSGKEEFQEVDLAEEWNVEKTKGRKALIHPAAADKEIENAQIEEEWIKWIRSQTKDEEVDKIVSELTLY